MQRYIIVVIALIVITIIRIIIAASTLTLIIGITISSNTRKFLNNASRSVQGVDNATHPTLAMALLREQVEGQNMVSFQGITVDDVGFDRSFTQGGKQSPTLFNVVMCDWLRPPSVAWKKRRQGHKTRTGTKNEDDHC